MMQDRIEKSVEIMAPVARVWRALTDHEEFGAWFRVKLDGPFVVGEVSRGHITYPGYEHLKWEAKVQAMETPRLFSFTWHPYAVDPDTDYSSERQTLSSSPSNRSPAEPALSYQSPDSARCPRGAARRLCA